MIVRTVRLATLALGLFAGGLCAAVAGAQTQWGRTAAHVVMVSAVGVAESAAFFGAVVGAVLGALLLTRGVLRVPGRLYAAAASSEPDATDAALVGTCWLCWYAGADVGTTYALCLAAHVAVGLGGAGAAGLALRAVLHVLLLAFSRRGGLRVRSRSPFPPFLAILPPSSLLVPSSGT